MRRWWVVLAMWLWATQVQAAPPRLRTTVLPSVGAAVHVVPPLVWSAQLQARFIVQGRPPGDLASVVVRTGPMVRVHPIVTVFGEYLFAEGVHPLEGPGDREHSAVLGLVLASRGQPFAVSCRTAMELRGVRTDGHWHFVQRPRSEVRLTGVFFPWLQLSGLAEVLVQSSLGRTDMLQIRTGLALHGELSRAPDPRPGARPRPALVWLVGARAAAFPVSMARGAIEDTDDPWEADRASTFDLLLNVGLAGVF